MHLSRRIILIVFLFSCSTVFAGTVDHIKPIYSNLLSNKENNKDILQKGKDTVVIRFDYKQSALYHSFTFDVLDSIINILLKNKDVTLSIDGYAFKDEGSDTICYYLSLNRALFIQTYILGRGVDSSRIATVTGHGKTKSQSQYIITDKDGFLIKCRAEVLLNYPPSPERDGIKDRDEDGIVDSEDKCPDVFGRKEKNGCPNTDIVIVPFEAQQSNLFSMTYKVLDSVVAVLSANPTFTIAIEGHAYKNEGINAVGNRLATQRSEIVKQYLLSRMVSMSRINSIKNFGNTRPLNAGKTPLAIIQNSRAEIIFTTSN